MPVVEVSRGGLGVAGLEECAGEVGVGIVEAADPVGQHGLAQATGMGGAVTDALGNVEQAGAVALPAKALQKSAG